MGDGSMSGESLNPVEIWGQSVQYEGHATLTSVWFSRRAFYFLHISRAALKLGKRPSE